MTTSVIAILGLGGIIVSTVGIFMVCKGLKELELLRDLKRQNKNIVMSLEIISEQLMKKEEA